MAHLSQRVFSKRQSQLGSSKSTIGATARSLCAGLFLALGIIAGISAWYSNTDTLAQFLIGTTAIAFLLVALLVMLERNYATTIGYSSIAFLIFVITINFILAGSVGIGFIWLFTLLFAIKRLFEFDQFLAKKRSTKNL